MQVKCSMFTGAGRSDVLRAFTYAILDREPFENVRHSLARGLGNIRSDVLQYPSIRKPKEV